MKLKASAQTCNNGHGGQPHGSLEGIDSKTGLPCTVLSAVYPHRLVQALVNDIQTYLWKRQALWVGDVMERELTDTSDHPQCAAASCNHSVSYWQCKRCQHGKVGGEHTLKPGGCRYAPGGEFEHQLPKLRSKEKKDEEKAKMATKPVAENFHIDFVPKLHRQQGAQFGLEARPRRQQYPSASLGMLQEPWTRKLPKS